MDLALLHVTVHIVRDADRDLGGNAGLDDDHRVERITHFERCSLEYTEREVERLGDPDVVGTLDDELVTA